RTCRGLAVGRTIFHEPARAWFSAQASPPGAAATAHDAVHDDALIAAVRCNYEALIEAWTATRAPRSEGALEASRESRT
ncbi:MAG: DUF2090 domain-containing protein, partial [Betaproteobacteria bacterium]